MGIKSLLKINLNNLTKINRLLMMIATLVIFSLYVTFFIFGVINLQNSGYLGVGGSFYNKDLIMDSLTSVIIDLIIVIIIGSMYFLKRTKYNPYSSILTCILSSYILDSAISYSSYNSLMYLIDINTSYSLTISLLSFSVILVVFNFINVVFMFMLNVSNTLVYSFENDSEIKRIGISYRYSIMDFDKLIYFVPFTLLVLSGLNLVIGAFRNYNSSGVISGTSYALSFYLCLIVGFIFMIVPIAIQFFNFKRQFNENLKKLINVLLGVVLSIFSVTFCFVIGFGTLELPIPYFIILSIFSLIYFLIALQSYFFLNIKTKKKDFFENDND